ncbi:hypothetical protein [Deinococcus radiotolerans]|uniref:Uncharacterized protein n=1 Tax=Deinococcus radiotolerans TaxID=1309407 RepID=A0ABQ2FRW0_9DEIO|nr:hypothetical protein [Deinococcus radiotolerans]GGL20469.1 hypothetical protein GCM10010844_44170 [Deinococcus radiotolerans]
MRQLAMWLVCSVLVTACTPHGPVAVAVPSDPHVLHGQWTGRVTPRNESGPVDTLSLNVVATYVDETHFAVAGTATFHQVTW